MFYADIIQKVWEKGAVVHGYDPSKWRKDFAGAWIKRDLYGTNQGYGWVIDHLRPRNAGGTDALENLAPLHWRNNTVKAADYPTFVTEVSSEGNENVERRRRWLIP